MQNYSIALSGLSTAQKALAVIGNNIANAATEGYHRQKVELAPAYSSQAGSILLGGGVDIAGISRVIDTLLEREILHQQSSLGQVSQELTTLYAVENAFGEFSVGTSVSTTIEEFFSALQDLSAHPSEIVWQSQAVTVGQTLAGQFRMLAEFLIRLETQITLEAETTIERINTLTDQVAELNDKIERMEIGGGQANNLRDQRDQCIAKLSELVGVVTQSREYGVVDVSVAGIPVVTSASTTKLEVGLTENKYLGVCAAGAHNYNTYVQGGRLGGLLSLNNELVSDVHDDLDALVNAIVEQVNQYHVQGVGSEGSFSELTGWTVAGDNLADFDPPITSGEIYFRVIYTDPATGTQTIKRHKIDIVADLPPSPSLDDFADYISTNIDGLTAWGDSSRLRIEAGSGYEFDFLPAVLPEPEAADIDFNGSVDPTVSVSGIYTGSSKDTFTFTVSGTGEIGNGTLTLTVTNSVSESVTTLNIGSGYAAGDKLDVGNGINISLSTGDLVNGDSFSIDAFADTDTSGLLAVVGINCFFSGSSAADIAVCSDIIDSPGRIATALGASLTDNMNALRLAGLKDMAASSLNGMTCSEFYRRLIADIGQEVSIKKTRQDNLEIMIRNLANRQSEISGVNVNDEAAQILIFEQMFQAMAKYLTTIQTSISTMMEIL